MPPFLAFCLTIGFVIYLFRRDFAEKPNVTRALWIPLIWMFIIGSRYLSEWLGNFGISAGAVSLEEGSPLDALLFLILIVSAARVLSWRGVNLSVVMRENRWLALFFFYGFCAILWSDFPFVAFKRWIKIIGHPLMVLVILTEPDPEEALKCLLRRVAYMLIPASVLLIKYYPDLGRGFDEWSGLPFNKGICGDKNALGHACLVLGFFFLWDFVQARKAVKSKARRKKLILQGGFLAMIGWLLYMAHSSTSLVSFVLAISVLVFLGFRFVDRRLIGTYIILGTLAVLLLEGVFGFSTQVLHLLGRNATLTDRTEVWKDCLQIPINPVLGAGFESFWLGERREKMWEKWAWQPNQAHNGYLETYLNLGLLGLLTLVGLIFATFWKSRRELLTNFEFGRFRMGLFLAILVYNWTESAFKGLSFVWFVFCIIAMDYPRARVTVPAQSELEAEESSALVEART
jgi:O-antigen ligase